MSLRDLKDISSDDLLKELERRKKAAAEERRNAAQRFAMSLSKAIVDVLAPMHGRTTCTDERMTNGFGSGDIPRCNRCSLLETLRDRYWPDDLEPVVEFSARKI